MSVIQRISRSIPDRLEHAHRRTAFPTHWKFSVYAVFLAGLISHLYIFSNRIVNPDGVFALKISGNTFTSGRWFLGFLTEVAIIFNDNYITPVMIGVIELLCFSIATIFIIDTFKVTNKWICALIGTVLISFPTVTSGNLYIFTAHYYAFAFLLSCISVWLICRKTSLLRFLASTLLLSFAMGIYQSYLTYVISLYVGLVLFSFLYDNTPIIKLIKKSVGYLFSILVGLSMYFAFNTLCLHLSNSSMDTYGGLDKMGHISISKLPTVILTCYQRFFQLFTTDFCGINHHAWTKKAFLLIVVAFFALIVLQVVKNRKTLNVSKILIIVLCLLIMPLALESIHLMVQEDWTVNTLTIGALAFLLVFPLIAVDHQINNASSKLTSALSCGIVAFVLLISVYYMHLSNETYLALEYANTNTNAYFSQLVTQIKQTNGYDDDLPVALIGNVEDKTISNVSCDYLLRGAFDTTGLINSYSRESFITMHCGYKCDFIDDVSFISQDPRVIEMPNYPNDNAIQIIDNVIVVKFSDCY